jgi:hypothetical protein
MWQRLSQSSARGLEGCGGRCIVAGVGVQAGDAETIVATGQGGSGSAAAEVGVSGDEAIAIDDDVASRNYRGDGALLRLSGARNA